MDDAPAPPTLEELSARADRLDALADTAALMGDEVGADRWKATASALRLAAMRLLDG